MHERVSPPEKITDSIHQEADTRAGECVLPEEIFDHQRSRGALPKVDSY